MWNLFLPTGRRSRLRWMLFVARSFPGDSVRDNSIVFVDHNDIDKRLVGWGNVNGQVVFTIRTVGVFQSAEETIGIVNADGLCDLRLASLGIGERERDVIRADVCRTRVKLVCRAVDTDAAQYARA